MFLRGAAALFTVCLLSIPAKATYVQYDITIAGTGHNVDYTPTGPIVITPTVFTGAYSIIFDSNNPNDVLVYLVPGANTITVGSYYPPDFGGYRTFSLTFTPGALNAGLLSKVGTADLVSSSFGFPTGGHRQQDFVDFGQVISLTTTFSDSRPPANIGVHVLSEVSTLAPVPEPASWALMILGFGAVGATLRIGRRPSRSLLLPGSPQR